MELVIGTFFFISKNHRGRTLLHIQCSNDNREEIIRFLVEECGADVNAKAFRDTTNLNWRTWMDEGEKLALDDPNFVPNEPDCWRYLLLP
jgi:hypothetical protein